MINFSMNKTLSISDFDLKQLSITGQPIFGLLKTIKGLSRLAGALSNR